MYAFTYSASDYFQLKSICGGEVESDIAIIMAHGWYLISMDLVVVSECQCHGALTWRRRLYQRYYERAHHNQPNQPQSTPKIHVEHSCGCISHFTFIRVVIVTVLARDLHTNIHIRHQPHHPLKKNHPLWLIYIFTIKYCGLCYYMWSKNAIKHFDVPPRW